jgi:CDP-diacylglycerol--serine O-phosphatidyltransferase
MAAGALLRGRYLVPNLASAANIAAGFGSMIAAAAGRFDAAVYLLCLAVVLDMFDGRLARALHATSEFGQQMDSFCDAISFCAAPAFLIFEAVLSPWGSWGAAIAAAFLLAGIYRLARFNLTADVHEKSERTLGVPTPVGAGYLMALALMRDRLPIEVGAAVVLVMAALMISTWALPEIKGRGAAAAILVVSCLLYVVFVVRPNWITASAWNLCNVAAVLVAGPRAPRSADGG